MRTTIRAPEYVITSSGGAWSGVSRTQHRQTGRWWSQPPHTGLLVRSLDTANSVKKEIFWSRISEEPHSIYLQNLDLNSKVFRIQIQIRGKN